LPCHEQYQPGLDTADTRNGQCAGAAIMRSNLDVAKKMPEALHQLPPDKTLIFANHAEFLAHHGQMTLADAQRWLLANPPSKLLRDQWEEAFAARGPGAIQLMPKKAAE
jgi:hypothetical protein